MPFVFDLISDLHVETWPTLLDFQGQATAPIAIVPGDISQDRSQLINTLTNLGQSYRAVFYIDGNAEHEHCLDRLGKSYVTLTKDIQGIKNVVYLQNNVVIVNGVAIIGTNGWWTFDFDPASDVEDNMSWYQQHKQISATVTKSICTTSKHDANYLMSTVKNLQLHLDVKKIVVVTHTVPDRALIEHDNNLLHTQRFNIMGNQLLMQTMAVDSENKIDTWCFGHYHGRVDQIRNGVRFVNNCRGRHDTPWNNQVYYPLRIVVDV